MGGWASGKSVLPVQISVRVAKTGNSGSQMRRQPFSLLLGPAHDVLHCGTLCVIQDSQRHGVQLEKKLM